MGKEVRRIGSESIVSLHQAQFSFVLSTVQCAMLKVTVLNTVLVTFYIESIMKDAVYEMMALCALIAHAGKAKNGSMPSLF